MSENDNKKQKVCSTYWGTLFLGHPILCLIMISMCNLPFKQLFTTQSLLFSDKIYLTPVVSSFFVFISLHTSNTLIKIYNKLHFYKQPINLPPDVLWNALAQGFAFKLVLWKTKLFKMFCYIFEIHPSTLNY